LPKRLILFVTAALLGAPVSSFAQISFANTSNYIGSGRWDWTIYVKADRATLDTINCVEYSLHSTFPDPVRTVCRPQSPNFAYSTDGWGTFLVKIRVIFNDKRVQNFQHQLVFTQPKIAAAPASSALTVETWSKQLEPGWWSWGIKMKGSAAALDRIRCVEYTLHSSFPNPVRTICTRGNNFELQATGWGTFTIPVKVLFKDKTILQLSHALRFTP
jgi:transcription initiation factor IIF auxiliary subunit